ncbi:MAG: hypothetical protein K0U98_11510 [Deltaproteobacteria bacterium]|nr:hypothetical protein [Deltaproteobacteria bacterium]
MSDFKAANLARANLTATMLDMAEFEGAFIEKTLLNRAAIGTMGSVVTTPIFREDFRWQVCKIGSVFSFDPDRTLGFDLHGTPEDSPEWLSRRGAETIYEAALRELGRYASNSIHLTFQESVWRDLVVIETGLRELFGEGVETKKTDGALTVSFQSTEDLQRGLDAILIQLAAKYVQDRQPVNSLVIQGEGDDCHEITNEDLFRCFSQVLDKMDSLGEDVGEVNHKLPGDKPEISDNQETLVRAAELVIPGVKLFSHRIRSWLASRDRKGAAGLPAPDLFRRAREGFRWSQKPPLRIEDGTEDAEILEEPAEGRLLGDGREEE